MLGTAVIGAMVGTSFSLMSWCEANGVSYLFGMAKKPRFVVTNLTADEYEARVLYEKLKEQQLYLFADRTSSATMRANQLRLWFSSLAYLILNELRKVGCAAPPWPAPPAKASD